MARANLVAWERQTPRLRAILEHHGRVDHVLFRPDGRAILTGSTDGTARLWDAATGQPLGPPLGHGEQVCCDRVLARRPACPDRRLRSSDLGPR